MGGGFFLKKKKKNVIELGWVGQCDFRFVTKPLCILVLRFVICTSTVPAPAAICSTVSCGRHRQNIITRFTCIRSHIVAVIADIKPYSTVDGSWLHTSNDHSDSAIGGDKQTRKEGGITHGRECVVVTRPCPASIHCRPPADRVSILDGSTWPSRPTSRIPPAEIGT